jgi:hypothetical protein
MAKAGAPKDNTNAEKWTEEKATELLQKAVDLSYNTDYDFIGEIAKELKTYIDVFDYLVEKFPHLKKLKNQMKRNCEANCFSNIKRENINTGAGIMNLKSNHGWTDRVQNDVTSKGDKIEQQPQFIVQTKEQGEKIQNWLNKLENE